MVINLRRIISRRLENLNPVAGVVQVVALSVFQQ